MIAIVTPDVTLIGDESYPTPAGMLTDWATIAKLIDERPAITTLLVTGRQADHDPRPMGNAGWQAGPMGDTGWMAFKMPNPRHHKTAYLWVGFLEDMHDDALIGAAARDSEYEIIASRLNWWRLTIGTEYRVSPAVSAVASMRDMGKRLREEPRWILQHPATAEWWQPPANIRSIRFGGALPGRWHFDRRAAYLADASTTYLPLRQLKKTGTDPLRYGYFRIRLANLERWNAHLWFAPIDENGCTWVGHSTMEEIRKHRLTHEIIDSETTDEATRVLRPWAERWRTALDFSPAARPHLKAGYAQALAGLIGVPRGTIYRPDWRHLLADAGNAHVMRTAFKVYLATGEWPQRVDVDSLYYATDVTAAFPVGGSIGNYQFKGITE